MKYGFDIFGGIQYAAQLTYKIDERQLEIWTDTTPLSNNSRCEVVPASAGRCTAGGLGITFTSDRRNVLRTAAGTDQPTLCG